MKVTAMNLRDYDVILLNTSAGKDSQAMLDMVVALAKEQGVLARVQSVHADLGQVEWKGTRELAERQCAHYGVKLTVVQRQNGDLLQQVEERGMWPDSMNRYCTSDQKRDQIAKLVTMICKETPTPGRKLRVLNCMGLRAQESSARAKKPALSVDKKNSNGKRDVTVWLPIHDWTIEQVWATIKASGCPHHYAYDLGMPRLSCCFCIFANRDALLLAGKHNPELLAKYVAVEAKIGHDFRHGFKIASIAADLAAGVQPKPVQSWTM